MAKIDFDRDLKVWARTGTVVGATKWSETKVSRGRGSSARRDRLCGTSEKPR